MNAGRKCALEVVYNMLAPPVKVHHCSVFSPFVFCWNVKLLEIASTLSRLININEYVSHLFVLISLDGDICCF